MVRRAFLAPSSQLSQRGVSARSRPDRVRRMATSLPRAIIKRPSPIKAPAIKDSPSQPYRTQGHQNRPHRQSRSPGQAVSWRMPPDAPPKSNPAVLNSSSRLDFRLRMQDSPMPCPHRWWFNAHGPRPHARAVSEITLLAFGKPHHLSNLCWAGLQKEG